MWLKSTPAIKFIWLILSTIKQNSDDIVLDRSKFCYFLICFSQGSVATRCRYGGKYDTSLVANLRMSPTVKIFENWSTFLKVMNEYQVAHFFMAHSVDHVCQRDTAIWKVWHHPHSTQTSTQSYKIFSSILIKTKHGLDAMAMSRLSVHLFICRQRVLIAVGAYHVGLWDCLIQFTMVLDLQYSKFWTFK